MLGRPSMKFPRLLLASLLLLGACTDDPDMTDTDSLQGPGIAEAAGGRLGVDYSWARPSPAWLRSQGYTFAARYVSYSTSGKNITRDEADALIAAGLDVVLVWEQTPAAALNGYGQGASDARAAQQQALDAGAPPDRPLYFAVDFDASAAEQGALNAYFDGVASVIGRNRTGAYGGYYVIQRLFDAGKIAWGWQTYAWSYGHWDPRAQVRQVQNGLAGGQMDLDQAIAPDFGQWGHGVPSDGPPPAAPPVPTQCGGIEPGHGLSRGQSWTSCDGRFTLAMQGDGNLVLYSLGVPLWSTGTNGLGGAIVVMQGDGNLVEYSEHSYPLFATGTDGHGGAHLAIQDDGNLVVYAGSAPLWDSHTAGMPAGPTGCGAIEPGHGLAVGQAVGSCDGQHALVLQGDGNLVLYHGGTATWSSGTVQSGARSVVMQGDGNLVIYGASGALWASGTDGHGGATLAVQDDGNLVLYQGGRAIWASGTNGR